MIVLELRVEVWESVKTQQILHLKYTSYSSVPSLAALSII